MEAELLSLVILWKVSHRSCFCRSRADGLKIPTGNSWALPRAGWFERSKPTKQGSFSGCCPEKCWIFDWNLPSCNVYDIHIAVQNPFLFNLYLIGCSSSYWMGKHVRFTFTTFVKQSHQQCGNGAQVWTLHSSPAGTGTFAPIAGIQRGHIQVTGVECGKKTYVFAVLSKMYCLTNFTWFHYTCR